MALMAALGIAGFVRRLAQGRWDLVAACLVVAPVGVVAFQSYGGEGGYRAYLFALPWLSLLAAYACASRTPASAGCDTDRPAAAWRRRRWAAACCSRSSGRSSPTACRPNDVRAALWYEQHAPAGSMRIDLAPDAPDRLTARYPVVDLSDPPSLVTDAQFVGHRLGARDVPRLIGLIKQQRARPAYVVLSALQENYARLQGLLPPGSLTGFVVRARALSAVPNRLSRAHGVDLQVQPAAGRSPRHGRGGRSHDHPGSPLSLGRRGSAAGRFVGAVSRAQFRAHVELIAASGRVPVTISALASMLRGDRPLVDRAVAITFDDGYADTYEAVEPLRRRGLCATVYVTTGEIGGARRLSAEQLVALAQLPQGGARARTRCVTGGWTNSTIPSWRRGAGEQAGARAAEPGAPWTPSRIRTAPTTGACAAR